MGSFVPTAGSVERLWHVIDAEGQVLGRIATDAARLLQGKRDFIADVIEALAGNAAPERLLQAARRVPLERPEALPGAAAAEADAVAAVSLALGLAYHEPVAGRGLDRLRQDGLTATGAVLRRV